MANHRKLNLLLVSISALLVLTAAPIFGGSETSETVILDTINAVRLNFLGMWDVQASSMRSSLGREGPRIDKILTYAKQNDANFEFCYSTINGMLTRFNSQFKANVPVSEDLLQKLSSHILASEDPERGVGILSYLLLDLAKIRPSSQIVMDSLSTIYDSYVASCYLIVLMLHYEYPSDAEYKTYLEKMNRGEGIYVGSNRSQEIAWCCEMFMVDLADSKPNYLPTSALEICEEFSRYKMSQVSDKRAYLSCSSFHDTMKYVDRLVKSLKQPF